MNFILKYKNVLIIAAVVGIAFVVYAYFFTGPAPQPLSSTSPAGQNAAADQQLISLLTTLHTIKLDNSLFSDPAFQSLSDFSTALVPEPVGRANPFLPLNGTASAGNTTGK